MAIVDNAFREWIAEFKAINPGFAESRQVIDAAQYAFAAGRKAQRDIDGALQPVGVKPALSAEEINALPEQARRYIMWLETEADPGHTTQQNFRLTEENKALRLLVAEMQKEAERGAGVLAGKVVAFEWDETRACVEFTSRPLIGTKLYTAPPAPAAVPVDVLVELQGIIDDSRRGPETGPGGCCVVCNRWTPWGHPEVDDHHPDCPTLVEWAKRHNWRARIAALIAMLSTHPNPQPAAAKDGDA